MSNELMKYISLLADMQRAGFKCEREIQEALYALHQEMGFKKKEVVVETSTPLKVLIVETQDNMYSTYRAMHIVVSALGIKLNKVACGRDYAKIETDKLIIDIIANTKISRGMRCDYLVNNSKEDISEFVQVKNNFK